LVVLLFVAPGMFFEQGVERCLTYWRTNLRDRVIRFIMWSVVVQVLLSPVSYALWTWRLAQDPAVPGWSYFLVAAVVVLLGLIIGPFAAGWALGSRASANPDDRFVRWLLGRDLAPRTWDHYFRSRHTPAWVRVRLRSGEWIAGSWCYASSYPEVEDVALDLIRCDPKTGEIASTSDGAGPQVPIPLGWQALVTREQVDLIVWQATAKEKEANP
jgi:hypothetical protein